MTRLNVKFLINTSIESILSNLNTIFENLLQEIKSYLNLDLKYSKIKIVYHEENISSDNLNQDIFKVGLIKTQKNNSLSVFISRTYRKFVRMILLREAYKFFIPRGLQDNRIINIFINQKVEIDLQKSEFIEEHVVQKRKSFPEVWNKMRKLLEQADEIIAQAENDAHNIIKKGEKEADNIKNIVLYKNNQEASLKKNKIFDL